MRRKGAGRHGADDAREARRGGELEAALAEHATAIRALGKRVVADVIEIGRRLTDAKRICGHGNWLPWLEREFGWTDDTALNFMRAHELSKSRNFRDLDLPVSALYLLAAPSTPAKAREEILERAQAGQPVSVADVKQTIDTAKGRKSARKTSTKPPTKPTAKTKSAAQTREDLGPASSGELERLQVQIEGLQNEKQQLKIKIGGLESEIEELKAARGSKSLAELRPQFYLATTALVKEDRVSEVRHLMKVLGLTIRDFDAAPADDGLDIPAWLRRASP
jgi:Protein of unknown function (DUF3102)